MRGFLRRAADASRIPVVPIVVLALLAAGAGANDAMAWSNLARLGDASGEMVSGIASVPLGPDRLVTATRGADGTLTVTQWRVEDNGAVTRIGSAAAGKVSRVEVAALGDRDLGEFIDIPIECRHLQVFAHSPGSPVRRLPET